MRAGTRSLGCRASHYEIRSGTLWPRAAALTAGRHETTNLRGMMRTLFLLLLLAGTAQAQTRGTLIVMGGGPWHDEIQKRFVELAGGANGTILVLPMASASADSGKSSVDGWKEYKTNAR